MGQVFVWTLLLTPEIGILLNTFIILRAIIVIAVRRLSGVTSASLHALPAMTGPPGGVVRDVTRREMIGLLDFFRTIPIVFLFNEKKVGNLVLKMFTNLYRRHLIN